MASHRPKLEISADWPAHEPVTMDIGPVLHRDDAVANKMAALYGRALPRDFVDIDAAIASGIYSHEQLLSLAEEADAGFDRVCSPTPSGRCGRSRTRRSASMESAPKRSPR